MHVDTKGAAIDLRNPQVHQIDTVVAPGINVRAAATPNENTFNPTKNTSVRNKAPVLPFQMALPALDAFPRKIWAQIGARCVRATRIPDMANPSVYGLESLRIAIATYLQVARGITCAPAQVFITSGYRNTLALIAHALLKPGDRVLVEDPGYPPTRELLEHLQIQSSPRF
jgi:GntR family transcriptional regulator/MocR family aminotransferase